MNEVVCVLESSRVLTKTRVGHGGALVETMTFNRRVMGSTLALAAK